MSTRRAFLFSYLDRYASIAISFTASVLISRLLTPAEVGVFSVAMVLIGFLGPFRDFGATQFVVQSPDLTDETLQTVRNLQLGLGVLLATVIAASSPWIANFYNDGRIRALMLPLGALSTALLTRELKFKELALVRFTGACGGALTSVLLAWRGFGPLSLAFGALAGSALTSFAAIYSRPVHLPWRGGLRNARRAVRFGSAMTGVNLLVMVYGNVAELSLARLQSLGISGLFGRAQGLVVMLERLLMEGANSVALPVFAAAIRDEKPLGDLYLRAIGVISAVGWTFFGLTACISPALIHILYGSQWASAAPIAQALCMSLWLLTPNLMFNQPLVALGRSGLILRVATFSTALQVMAVVPAAAHSLQAACIALNATALVMTIILSVVSKRVVSFTWPALAKTLAHSLGLAICCLSGPVLVMLYVAGRPELYIAQILVSAALTAVAFLFFSKLVGHPVASEIQQILARRQRKARSASEN
ncbi:MAG: hypothetical protein CFE44_20180 [Burkholderiales bacterium PBB4]|nr:MAG: hypothetical protein CFE44_20180 [Burkholderiales bacterium PBB4]